MKIIRFSVLVFSVLCLQFCAPKEDPEFLELVPSFQTASFNDQGYFKLSLTSSGEVIPSEKAIKYFDMEGEIQAQYKLNFSGLEGLHALIISDNFVPILYLLKSDGLPTEVIVLDENTYISSTGGITIGQHGFQVAPDGTIEHLGEVDLNSEKLSLRFRLSELGGTFPVSTQQIQPEDGILTSSTEEGEWYVSMYDHSTYTLADGRKLLLTGKLSELDMMRKTQLFLTCYSNDGNPYPTQLISDSETGLQSLIQDDLLLQLNVVYDDQEEILIPEFKSYRISPSGVLEPNEEPVEPRPDVIRQLATESPGSFLVASQFQTDGDGMEGIESTVFFQRGELLVNYNYSGGIYMLESYSFYLANGKFVDVIYNRRENQVMLEPLEISETSRHYQFSEDGEAITLIMDKSLQKELEEYDEMDEFDTLYANIPMQEYRGDHDFVSELRQKYNSTLSAAVTPVVYDWD